MSDSPIFNQIAAEFAAEGKGYEELVKWTTPAFVWSRYVVRFDKQKSSAEQTLNMNLPSPSVKPLFERNTAQLME